MKLTANLITCVLILSTTAGVLIPYSWVIDLDLSYLQAVGIVAASWSWFFILAGLSKLALNKLEKR